MPAHLAFNVSQPRLQPARSLVAPWSRGVLGRPVHTPVVPLHTAGSSWGAGRVLRQYTSTLRPGGWLLASRVVGCAAPANAAIQLSPSSSSVKVRFIIPEFQTSFGQELAIAGSLPELGAWQAERAVRMKWAPGHSWAVDIEVPADCVGAEYKVVLLDGGSCIWEPGPNRKLHPPKGGSSFALEVVCAWGVPAQERAQAVETAPPPTAAPMAVMEEAVQAPLAPSSPNTVPCHVVVPLTNAKPGQRLVFVGSLPQLGNWQPAQGLRLSADQAGLWQARAALPVGETIHAKLALVDDQGGCQWESGGNRTFNLDPPPGAAATAALGTGTDGAPPVTGDGYLIMCHYNLPDYQQVVYRTMFDAGGSSAGSSDGASAAELTRCQFTVPRFDTQPGQQLMVVGSLPQFGQWDAGKALSMTWQPGNAWVGQVELPPEAEAEIKLVLADKGKVTWEPGPNKQLSLPQLLSTSGPAGAAAPSQPGQRVVLDGREYIVRGAECLASCQWGAADMPVLVVPKLQPVVCDQPASSLMTVEAGTAPQTGVEAHAQGSISREVSVVTSEAGAGAGAGVSTGAGAGVNTGADLSTAAMADQATEVTPAEGSPVTVMAADTSPAEAAAAGVLVTGPMATGAAATQGAAAEAAAATTAGAAAEAVVTAAAATAGTEPVQDAPAVPKEQGAGDQGLVRFLSFMLTNKLTGWASGAGSDAQQQAAPGQATGTTARDAAVPAAAAQSGGVSLPAVASANGTAAVSGSVAAAGETQLPGVATAGVQPVAMQPVNAGTGATAGAAGVSAQAVVGADQVVVQVPQAAAVDNDGGNGAVATNTANTGPESDLSLTPDTAAPGPGPVGPVADDQAQPSMSNNIVNAPGSRIAAGAAAVGAGAAAAVAMALGSTGAASVAGAGTAAAVAAGSGVIAGGAVAVGGVAAAAAGVLAVGGWVADQRNKSNGKSVPDGGQPGDDEVLLQGNVESKQQLEAVTGRYQKLQEEVETLQAQNSMLHARLHNTQQQLTAVEDELRLKGEIHETATTSSPADASTAASPSADASNVAAPIMTPAAPAGTEAAVPAVTGAAVPAGTGAAAPAVTGAAAPAEEGISTKEFQVPFDTIVAAGTPTATVVDTPTAAQLPLDTTVTATASAADAETPIKAELPLATTAAADSATTAAADSATAIEADTVLPAAAPPTPPAPPSPLNIFSALWGAKPKPSEPVLKPKPRPSGTAASTALVSLETQLSKAREVHEHQVTQLQAAMKTKQAELEARVQELEQALARAVSESQDKESAQSGQVMQTKFALREATAALVALEDRTATELQAKEEAFQLVKAGLQSRVSELEVAVAEWQSRQAQAAAEAQAASDAAAQEAQVVSELKQQAMNLSAQIASLKQEQQAAQARQAELLAEQQALLASVEATYQTQLAALSTQLQAKDVAQQELQQQAAKANEEISALQGTVAEQQYQLDAQTTRVQVATEEALEYKRRYEQERAKALANAAEIVPQLQAELDRTKVMAEQEVAEQRMVFNAMLGDARQAAEAERTRLERALQSLTVMYESQASQARAAAAAEVQSVRQQAEEDLKLLASEHASAAADLEAQVAEAQVQLEQELGRTSKVQAATTAAAGVMQRDFQLQAVQLRQDADQRQVQAAARLAALQSQLFELRAEQTAALLAADAQHAAAVQVLKDTHEAELVAMQREHETRVAELQQERQQLQEEVRSLKLSHEQEVAQLKTTLQAEAQMAVEELQKQHEDVMTGLKAALAEREQAVQASLQKASEQARAVAQAMEQQYEQQLESLKQEHAAAVQQLQDQLATATDVNEDLQAKLAKARDLAEQQISELQATAAARQAAAAQEFAQAQQLAAQQLEELRLSHASQVAAMVATHEQQLQQMTTAQADTVQQALVARKQEAEAEVQQLKEAHALELEAVKREAEVAARAAAQQVVELKAQHEQDMVAVLSSLRDTVLSSTVATGPEEAAGEEAGVAKRLESEITMNVMSLRRSLVQAEERVQQLQDALHEKSTSVQELMAQLEQAQSDVVAPDANAVGVTAVTTPDLNAAQQQVAVLMKQLSEEQAARAALASATTTGQNTVDVLRAQLSNALLQSSRQLKAAQQAESALLALRAKYDGLCSEQDVLLAQAQQANAARLAAEEEIERQKASLDKVKQELHKQMKSQQAPADASRTRQMNLAVPPADSEQRIFELEADLATTRAQLEQAQRENQELVASTAVDVARPDQQAPGVVDTAAAEQIESLLSRVKELEQEVVLAREQEAQRYQAEVARLTAEYQDQLQALKLTHDEVVKEAVARAEQETFVLQSRVDELEDELSDIKMSMKRSLGMVLPPSPPPKPPQPASNNDAKRPSIRRALFSIFGGNKAPEAAGEAAQPSKTEAAGEVERVGADLAGSAQADAEQVTAQLGSPKDVKLPAVEQPQVDARDSSRPAAQSSEEHVK